MAKLNWDKVRKDNLMKKHGFETVSMTYPKIFGTDTYRESEYVTGLSSDDNKIIKSIKPVDHRYRTCSCCKQVKQKKKKFKTANTNKNLIQCTKCHSKVSRKNEQKHNKKVHRGVSSLKQSITIPQQKPLRNKKTMNYIITAHAIEQFVNRLKMLGISTQPKHPEKTIQKFLARAIPENISPIHRTQRLINNEFKIVRYLVTEGWRFVVSEDNVVITIERVNPAQN